MSLSIGRASTLASSFPTVEVPYEDLLAAKYVPGGRGNLTFDCMGLVLEIYFRAGLKLPDPFLAGASITEFAELFEEVSSASLQLFDMVTTQDGGFRHVSTVIRPGMVIDTGERRNVSCVRVNILKRLDRRWWRVRADCLPQ